MRVEGSKSRTHSGWAAEHLPAVAELRSSPEEAAWSLSLPPLTKKETSESRDSSLVLVVYFKR